MNRPNGAKKLNYADRVYSFDKIWFDAFFFKKVGIRLYSPGCYDDLMVCPPLYIPIVKNDALLR